MLKYISHLHPIQVTDQYLREWTSPSSAVSIKKIYQVTNPRDVLARNDAYRYAFGFGSAVIAFRRR